MAAKSEADARNGFYNKLKNLITTQHNIVGLTQSAWDEINKLWTLHQYQLQFWLWTLDSQLPGDFSVVGKWLAEAEKLLYYDDIPTQMNEQTAAIISRKLEEHKQFFANLDQIKDLFYRTKQSPIGGSVPADQLRSMEQRLLDVGPKAHQRRLNLKFLEHKCCLVAFLNLIETKMRPWNGKYGREDKAKLLLQQYNDFVHKNKVFQEFGKAFMDMQQVVEECRRDGNLTRQDAYEVDRFMRETEERWKRLSRDLKCCQNMLEECVANWHRWNAGADEFEGWLCRAEAKLRAGEDERLEFFQDISQWKDRHQVLQDTATFLIATCEEPIADELRDKFHQLSMRFSAVYAQTKQYMHSSDILRNRQEYRQGSDRLAAWLAKAEATLAQQIPCTTDAIKAYGNELQLLAQQMDDIEEVFKYISKVIQTLVPDMTRAEVEHMMATLKQQKAALVRVRSQIPLKLHLFHQLYTQQESLEQGQKEIHHWLDEAEALLQTLSLNANRDQLQEQLNKHRTFFARTLYYKAMVESKSKAFQHLLQMAASDGILETSDVQQKMSQLNDRFAYVSQNAQQWEQRLQDADSYWSTFKETERQVTEWIYKAEVFLTERHIESKQMIDERKAFFDSVNTGLMDDLVASGQNLLQTLPMDEQQKVVQNVDELQARYENVLRRAPQHLTHLQFNLHEANFGQAVKDIEKEIQLEQQALNRNEDVDVILARHQDFLNNRRAVAQAENCLDNMQAIGQQYGEQNPNDHSLRNVVHQAQVKWDGLKTRLDELQQKLHQIPVQWQLYREKYAAMEAWMNDVDRTLKSIVQEVTSNEEFERERLVFQVSFSMTI